MNNDDIKVSIVCLAYNHKPYIKQTIESFLMQKTNFKYEIIIHDDASTDGTAQIISSYSENYKDIIIPIMQSENKYSKRISITRNYIYPLIRGKYVAICEGDDYWLDINKLQKQIDFLDSNPDYSICTHAYKLVNVSTGKSKDIHSFLYTGEISPEQVIEGDGHLFATNSIVCKKEVYINPPEFRKNAPVGDYPLLIHASFEGKIHYIDEVMSAYRYMVPNSWTVSNFKSLDTMRSHIEKMQDTLNEADKHSNYLYHVSFQKIIDKKWIDYYLKIYSLSKLRKIHPEYYKKISWKRKIYIILKKYCPLILKLYVFLGDKI